MYSDSFQCIPAHYNALRSITMHSGPFSMHFNSFESISIDFNIFKTILFIQSCVFIHLPIRWFFFLPKRLTVFKTVHPSSTVWKLHLIYRLNSTKADENWIKCQWKMHCFSLKIGLKRIWMNAQGADTNGRCHHRRWIQCVPCIISCQQMGLRP